jgi:hypothetical protein
LVVTAGAGQLIVVVKKLPLRRLSDTLALPRSTTQIESQGLTAELEEELCELIERSLLRGGG